MPDSLFDAIMAESTIPALETVFGIPATHTNADGDETALTVMLQMELAPTGDFGERMEERKTLELAKSHGAAIGDTFSIENAATDDDPLPDPTVWRATQLMADDGYLQKFAVIETPA